MRVQIAQVVSTTIDVNFVRLIADDVTLGDQKPIVDGWKGSDWHRISMRHTGFDRWA